MPADRDSFTRDRNASDERYRLLFDVNPLPMWVYDLDTLQFLDVNRAAVSRYGYSRSEFLRMRITDIRPPSELPKLMDNLALQRQGWQQSGAWRHQLKSGEIIDVDITSHKISFGGQRGVLVTAIDVTARVRSEAKLTLLAHALESTNEMVSVHDLDTRFTFVNHAFLRTLGYTAEELIGQLPHMLWSDAMSAALRDEILTEWQRGTWEGELIARCKDGSDKPVYISTSLIREPDGRAVGIMAVARDLTESKRAEQAVRAAEERARFALEASGGGIWDADLRTGTSHWSELCEKLHGLEPGTFGGNFDAFIAAIHPDDREQVLKAIDAAVRERTDPSFEYRTVWPDGTVRWITNRGRFFYDADGTPVRGAGVSVDMTERKVLEDQLRQAQKMEAVGRLAGGIAHDFNNLLTAIKGFAELLAASLPAPDARRADVAEILRAANRAATLTHQLLAFSRKQILAPRVIRMGDVVERLAPMLRSLLGEAIELRTVVGEAGYVEADVGQLEHVLVDLITNARDAMPTGGKVTIRTRDVVLDDNFARDHPGAGCGPHIVLSVSDTGHGIDPAIHKRIFEPFFTTKPTGRGTGLGLATAYGIIKQSGGSIYFETERGRGTTFSIYLPRTTKSAVHG